MKSMVKGPKAPMLHSSRVQGLCSFVCVCVCVCACMFDEGVGRVEGWFADMQGTKKYLVITSLLFQFQ